MNAYAFCKVVLKTNPAYLQYQASVFKRYCGIILHNPNPTIALRSTPERVIQFGVKFSSRHRGQEIGGTR